MGKRHDIVVFGASGLVGQLVAARLVGRMSDPSRWALAGRDVAGLARLRDRIGAPADLALIHADAGDATSLRKLAASAAVVLTTVGPYARFGSSLVQACVETGAGYVDLCGEPIWMRQMIDRFEVDARRSGARIVFSCGYDSIPFECGVAELQRLCIGRWGRPASRVACRVVGTKGGGLSSGTTASLLGSRKAAAGDPGLASLMASPFALCPGFEGPEQPASDKAFYDPVIGHWVAPHVMAAINAKNVHRSNLLSGFAYGQGFQYDEMVIVKAGREAAEKMAATDRLTGATAVKPNSAYERPKDGFFRLLFMAHDPGQQPIAVSVAGDQDPGYGSTSRMLVEAAQCLALDDGWPAGIWTPGALMGCRLVEQLQQRAGLEFASAPDTVADWGL